MASVKEIKGKKGISYQITVINGKDIHGKQIRAYKTWTPPAEMGKIEIKRELERIKVAFENDFLENGKAKDRITFKEYSDYVMSIKTYSPRTRDRNIELLGRINDSIGHLKLGDIKAKHLNKFFISLQADGVNKRTGGGLSPKTILEHRRLINMILKKAIIEEIISKNPVEQTEKIKEVKKKVKVFQQEDLEKLFQALETAPLKWKLQTYMLLTLGCRRGELLGLKFKDVSLTTGLVEIERQVNYSKNMGTYEGTTKTDEEHTNNLPDVVLEMFKEYKKEYAQYMKDCPFWQGESNIENCYIFIQDNGKVQHPDSLTDWLNKFSVKKGLAHANPHKFRHTYASLLLKSKVDIVTVSKLLAHTSPTTTLKFYSHLMGDAGETSKETFNNYFQNIQ